MASVFQDLENHLPVQILLLFSLGLQVILFLCAGVRRHGTSSGVQALLLWLSYHIGHTFAAFTLGRLSFFSAAGSHPLVELWAPFLLLHLAGPDNIAAYKLQDGQHSLRSLQTFVTHVTAGGYFLYTYRNSSGDFLRLAASGLMFVVAVVKYGEWWLAVQRCNLGSIRHSVKKKPPAMDISDDHPQDVTSKDIEEGDQRLDEEFHVRGAHSLFHICKSGIVDFSEDAPDRQIFIRKMKGLEYWPIVEIELSLMYDILYTKAAVIHTWHGYTIRAISPIAIITSLLLFHFSEEEDRHTKVDIVITYVLFGSALFMEWISLLNALGSSWMFTTLSTTRWQWLRNKFLSSGRWDRLRRLVASLNSLVTCGGSRRWSGKMGQYNMLHFCTRPDALLTCPLLGRLAEQVGLGELWNRKHFSGASTIKVYINNHMNLLYVERGLSSLGMIKLRWGMTTLVRRNLEKKFEVTLGNEFQEGIIIWHVGTDFFLSKCKSSADHEDLVNAIKALSNYMMFLLVERPYMLPPGMAQNKLYERTCKALEGVSHQPTGICGMLKSCTNGPVKHTRHPTLSKVKEEGWGMVRFRRTLFGETLTHFDSLKTLVDQVQLDGDTDRVRCSLTTSGNFQVKTMYHHLRASTISPHKYIWKVKMPLKVKVFIWTIFKNSILTKDNLLKRGWTGNEQCHFCSHAETVDHLLFQCNLAKLIWNTVVCAMGFARAPISAVDLGGNWINAFPKKQRKTIFSGCAAVCWTLWKNRNDACFNQKFPNDPADVVYRLCRILNAWTMLQRKQEQRRYEKGIEQIKMVLREIFSRSHGWAPRTARLTV